MTESAYISYYIDSDCFWRIIHPLLLMHS